MLTSRMLAEAHMKTSLSNAPLWAAPVFRFVTTIPNSPISASL